MTNRAGTRLSTAVATALMLASMASACGSGEVQGAGADLSKVGPGPSVGAGASWDLPATPPAAPATTESAGAGPTTDAKNEVASLQSRLRDALATRDPDAVASSVAVEQRSAAEDQLVVTWTVSTNVDDTTAPTRLRIDIIELLRVVKLSRLSYGSVLLVAHGAVLNELGQYTDSQVVRAKYSRELVAATDFTSVAPGRILSMPDDKPAEIHPAYR